MEAYIIDDDQLSVFLAKTKLTLAIGSLSVIPFYTAQEALDSIMEKGLPDLILLDLQMPVMDGWGFLAALSKFPPSKLRTCRVFILSSSVSEADAAKAESYEMVQGILQKPLQTKEVDHLIALLKA